MPPRQKRSPAFTQADIDQQLQQIHLLDPSSTSENLEQLAPIIKSIHESGRQEAFLRTLSGLIESKEAEIERICGDNYQDFVSSVSTLLTVRSYTANLKDRISSLDTSVADVGSSLTAKKKQLNQSKRTASNLDEAIDTLQACLRVLDLVNRVGDMVKNGKYYTALRSLDDIQNLPPSSLSQTPFFTHLLSSLPSLRAQIKDAVTASTKSWLLEIRESSELVGSLALEAVENRNRRWRSKRDKEPSMKSSRVGSAVEVATNEKVDFNVLDNDQIHLEFKSLYQCILIYTAMGSLDEIQRSYQEDRKTQAALILAQRLSTTPFNLVRVLPELVNEIVGFFIIEAQVIRTTESFRAQKDVDDLWESVVPRVVEAVERGVKDEKSTDTLLQCKGIILGFAQALEGHGYETSQLHALLFRLFERYVSLIQSKYTSGFQEIVVQDDLQPMVVDNEDECGKVLSVCWLDATELDSLTKQPVPASMPFSQFYPLCCVDIRSFMEKFYYFLEGVPESRRDVDELLRRTLDTFIDDSICRNLAERMKTISQPSQIAQVITNVEHLLTGCRELEKQLATMRPTSRGTSLRLNPAPLQSILNLAFDRIRTLIRSKLDDFFGLSEYDWRPSQPERSPSMYLYELVNWLTTVVDSLAVGDSVKEQCYEDAMEYLADCFMEFLAGSSVPSLTELAIANLLVDVDFLESEFSRRGRGGLGSRFVDVRTLASIPLQDAVPVFMKPVSRQRPQGQYARVDPRKLSELLGKLAKAGASSRTAGERDRAEKRRREAIEVSRLA